MKMLDKNLVFLFGVVLLFLLILIWCDQRFPNDGQIFQIVAGLLTGASAIFLAAARHAFGLPDEKSGGSPSASSTVNVSQMTTDKPKEDHTE